MLQKNWSELIKPTKMEVNVDENNGRIGKLTAEPLERGFERSSFPPCQYRRSLWHVGQRGIIYRADPFCA